MKGGIRGRKEAGRVIGMDVWVLEEVVAEMEEEEEEEEGEEQWVVRA